MRIIVRGFLLLGLILVVGGIPGSAVWAHESFPAGPYTVEVGWLNEPPVTNQPNAIVVNVSAGEPGASSTGTPPAEATSSEANPAASSEIDTSGLMVMVSYGGQSKMLTLEPQSEETPNNLKGVLTPTIMGQYTLEVSGKLNGDLGPADVSIKTNPEEVQGPEVVQFPVANSAEENPASPAPPPWVPWAALAAGVIGIVLGAIALVRK